MAILSVRRHAWTVPRGADPKVKAYPDAERLPLPDVDPTGGRPL
ncbi:MAG: hypothetical protein AB2L07_02645 [Thermoanaerobaculaceae bacterium]